MKSTFTKILDASEKQFALYGVEGISLRQVIAAAGVSQGSLHYHFGGKDGLLEAVLDRCLPPLMAERTEILRELTARPQAPTPRELLSGIALPLARRAIDGGAAGKRTVPLLARLYGENNAVYLRTVEKYFKDVNFVFIERLQAALPALSKGQIELRVQIAFSAIFSTLVAIDTPPKAWQAEMSESPFEPWTIVDELLDFLAQGFGNEKPQAKRSRPEPKR